MSAEQDRIDAERWRYIRQFLHVDRWELSPASQLGAYTFKIPFIVGRSDATVEEIIDAARAASSSSPPLSETPSERIWACKCGDPTCVQWRENVVCAFCSARLREITSDPEFDGRAGDMGEGHYADCPHGAVAASLAPLSEPTSEGT